MVKNTKLPKLKYGLEENTDILILVMKCLKVYSSMAGDQVLPRLVTSDSLNQVDETTSSVRNSCINKYY